MYEIDTLCIYWKFAKLWLLLTIHVFLRENICLWVEYAIFILSIVIAKHLCNIQQNMNKHRKQTYNETYVYRICT